jgi:AcrR family transcriptional regulator
MYKQCKSEKSAQRQAHIANCLQQLLQEKSYEDISITELCRKAEVPRSVFYRYFADKDAVLWFAIDGMLADLLEILLQIYDTQHNWQLIDFLTYWLTNYRENETLWQVANTGSRHSLLLGHMVRHQTKMANPLYKVDFNNEETKRAIFFAYGIQGILDVWRKLGYTQSEQEVARQLCNLLHTPLLKMLPSTDRVRKVVKDHREQTYYAE